jgi:hypothetical protein
MKLSIPIFLLFLSTMLCLAKDKTCPSPETVKDSKFHPGQVWQYRARRGEEKSFLTILRVEFLPKSGTIIHIRVDNVRLRNCTGGPEPDKFEHMPFTRDAIERSVSKLLKENSEIPDYKSGYDEWQRDCGGVYTITVAEAVAVAEATFRSGLGCGSTVPTK